MYYVPGYKRYVLRSGVQKCMYYVPGFKSLCTTFRGTKDYVLRSGVQKFMYYVRESCNLV